jgi:signal transduction histidine kinase
MVAVDRRTSGEPLRVLFVEDSEADAELVRRDLHRSGYEIVSQRVETREGLAEALQKEWDIVLSDFHMPRFRGDHALDLVRGLKGPDLPFIVISGTLGDERVVALLKAGANDFVVKANLLRLIPAIDRELKDAQMRRERAEAIEGLRQAIEVRDEFLLIASHELKTPLTSLLLQLQRLERVLEADDRVHEKPSAGHQKLDLVLRLADRMSVLVEHLLDVSRVTFGQLQIHRTEVDLCKLLGKSVEEISEVAARERSEVRINAPERLIGSWDPDRISMVVTNLLANALKYGSGHPVDVLLEDRGETALIRMRDRGIGIAPEDQARIFGRFERAASSRHFGGFGVGLWLSRQIIEAHGGSIRLQSEPAKGSTFEVELPKRDIGQHQGERNGK